MRFALSLLFALAAAPAHAACRLALVLALDVSASVDATEYRLQAQGMAAALLAPAVQDAILADPGAPVALSAFVWSGPGDQSLIADWTLIDSAARLEAFAAAIAAHPRRVAFDGRTAIGSALQRGAFLHDIAPPCGRRVIDIAVDGINNAGTPPHQVRDGAALADITVNALAIGSDDPETPGFVLAPRVRRLASYLDDTVIRGPDAFVEVATDYRDFERAMTRKLERELGVLMLGRATPPGRGAKRRPKSGPDFAAEFASNSTLARPGTTPVAACRLRARRLGLRMVSWECG